MVYFALCFMLLRGDVPRSVIPDQVIAERLLADLERLSGLQVRRIEPELDTKLVLCRLRNEEAVTANVLVLLLRAQGIYIHRVHTSEGAPALFASLSPRPPRRPVPKLAVAVYCPEHREPEELIDLLKSKLPEGVSVVLEPRTGKLIFRGSARAEVGRARRAAAQLDRPARRARLYHLFRFKGMFLQDGYRELLRRLPEEVRRRAFFVLHTRTNTLLVGCGSSDWERILGLLERINPDGGEPEGEENGEPD